MFLSPKQPLTQTTSHPNNFSPKQMLPLDHASHQMLEKASLTKTHYYLPSSSKTHPNLPQPITTFQNLLQPTINRQHHPSTPQPHTHHSQPTTQTLCTKLSHSHNHSPTSSQSHTQTTPSPPSHTGTLGRYEGIFFSLAKWLSPFLTGQSTTSWSLWVLCGSLHRLHSLVISLKPFMSVLMCMVPYCRSWSEKGCC